MSVHSRDRVDKRGMMARSARDVAPENADGRPKKMVA